MEVVISNVQKEGIHLCRLWDCLKDNMKFYQGAILYSLLFVF